MNDTFGPSRRRLLGTVDPTLAAGDLFVRASDGNDVGVTRKCSSAVSRTGAILWFGRTRQIGAGVLDIGYPDDDGARHHD